MSLVKKLAGETAIYGLSSILSRILYFVVFTVYLTRIFEDQVLFGIYQDIYAYAALLLILFIYRLETAYFRFGSDPTNENAAFSSASISILTTTVLSVTALILFREDLINLLQYPGRGQYVTYFAFITGFDALAAIPFARLRLKNRPYRFMAIKMINIVSTLVCIFFFLEVCPWLIDQGYVFFGRIYHFDIRLDLIFISNLIASTVVLLMLLPEFRGIKLALNKDLLKKMLLYTFPLVIVGLAGVFNQSWAVPILKNWLPGSLDENLSNAGIYSAAAKLAILMALFTQAFNYAAEPFFFKQKDNKNAPQTYADVAQAFTLVASIGFLVICLYLDLIQYLLGENYRSGIHIVPILLLAGLFLGIYYNFSIWYKIKDKTYIGSYISIAGVVITLCTAYFLIPSVGYIAMAWAALGCYLFMAIAGYLTGQHYYPVPYPIGRMLIYIISAVLIVWLSWISKAYLPALGDRLLLNTGLFGVYLVFILLIDKQKLKSWVG